MNMCHSFQSCGRLRLRVSSRGGGTAAECALCACAVLYEVAKGSICFGRTKRSRMHVVLRAPIQQACMYSGLALACVHSGAMALHSLCRSFESRGNQHVSQVIYEICVEAPTCNRAAEYRQSAAKLGIPD